MRRWFRRAQTPHRARAPILALALGLCGAGAAGVVPFAYVPNSVSGTVSVIDTATNTVVATVTVDTLPNGVAVTPLGDRVYVTNSAGAVASAPAAFRVRVLADYVRGTGATRGASVTGGR